MLTENITKSYKHGNKDIIDDINEELKYTANELSIDNKICTMAKKNAFITLKDHKENFTSNPKWRLLNRAKSELGKISKIILDHAWMLMMSLFSSTTNVNQLKN